MSLLALRPPDGFDLIMADPPWTFVTRSPKGITPKGAGGQYRTMTLLDIAALPVAEVAARHCLLWLWATNPMLPQAFEVMQAWGFTYKTAGTWVKRTRTGKIGFGTGYLLRSANEPFLIGTRGQPRTSRNVRSVVTSGEDATDQPSMITIEGLVREHSRKPDEAYIAAETLMPAARRLDMFSRQRRLGWTAWGDEVDKFSHVEN
jgi:N6-adenosine-specific RNA methylase IME4